MIRLLIDKRHHMDDLSIKSKMENTTDRKRKQESKFLFPLKACTAYKLSIEKSFNSIISSNDFTLYSREATVTAFAVFIGMSTVSDTSKYFSTKKKMKINPTLALSKRFSDLFTDHK